MAGVHLHLLRPNLHRSTTATPPCATTGRQHLAGATHHLSYWDSIHSDIYTHLKKTITIRDPTTVFEPMHHLTFAPPRTSASALCVAACEVVGGDRADAVVAASAIHLMHATIYTHDRLLTRDHPGSGLESVLESGPEPHKFGANIELLIGDGIMPFGFELLAGSGAGDNSEKILQVIIEITRAIGAQGMITMIAGGTDSVPPARQLHGCGAACGAIIGGGTAEEIERLKRYGVYVGKIQGLVGDKGESGGGEMELVEKWRALALKELEYFDNEKIELISSIVRG